MCQFNLETYSNEILLRFLWNKYQKSPESMLRLGWLQQEKIHLRYKIVEYIQGYGVFNLKTIFLAHFKSSSTLKL